MTEVCSRPRSVCFDVVGKSNNMLKRFPLSIAHVLMLVLIAEPSLAKQPQKSDYRGFEKVVLDELKETSTSASWSNSVASSRAFPLRKLFAGCADAISDSTSSRKPSSPAH